MFSAPYFLGKESAMVHDSGSTDVLVQSEDLCDVDTVVKLDKPVIFGTAATPRPLVATHKGRMTLPSCCSGVDPVVLEDCYVVPNIPIGGEAKSGRVYSTNRHRGWSVGVQESKWKSRSMLRLQVG